MTKRITLFVLLCALAMTAGCSKRHVIQIESDTCWNGIVNGDQYVNDCGNSTYRVIGTLRCVRVRRTGDTGALRVRIDEHPWVSTVDQYGYVQACN